MRYRTAAFLMSVCVLTSSCSRKNEDRMLDERHSASSFDMESRLARTPGKSVEDLLKELLDSPPRGHALAPPEERAPGDFIDRICRAIEALDARANIHLLNIEQMNTTAYKRKLLTGYPDMSQGAFEVTERELDFAIDGKGFFQVQLRDGCTGYTRAGLFQMDRNGRIMNPSGYPLMEDITVPEDVVALNLSPSGIVEAVRSDGQTVLTLGQIQLAVFINPAGLHHRGDGIYTETPASGQPQLNNPGLGSCGVFRQRVLECSNVSPLREQVLLYEALRQQAMLLNIVASYNNTLGQIQPSALVPCEHCGK